MAVAVVVILWSAVFAVVLPAPRSAGAQTTRPEGQGPDLHLPSGHDHETIPLSRGHSWLLVPVSINGKEAGLFMVDTGATITIIDEGAADKIALVAPPTRGRMTSASHSSVSTKMYRVDSLSIGSATMRNMVIGGADLSGLRTMSGIPIVGVVGDDVLGAMPCTLDYFKPSLTFHRRAAFAPPQTTKPHALEIHGRMPLLRAQVQGREGWFELDTGAMGRLDLEGPFLAFNRDAFKDQVMVPTIAWDAGGRVDEFVTHVRSIRFLAHEQTDVATHVSMGHYDINANSVLSSGRIGGRLLDDARLTLDFESKQIWAEWPERLPADAMARRFKEIAAGDLSGGPAVLWAASSRRTDALEVLLKQGADANAADKSGFTALMSANGDAVKLLVAHGANPNAQAAVGGLSPLASCAEDGDAEGVKALLAAGAKPDVPKMTGETPLLVAAQAKSLEAVRALIEAGANVNTANKGDETPLIAAAWQGSEPIVSLLLEHGADPDRRSKDGSSALMLAASWGHAGVVKALLSHGARVNLPYEKSSALHEAVRSDDPEVVKLLLDAGAKRDATDEDGLTPEQLGYARSRTFALRVFIDSPTTQRSK